MSLKVTLPVEEEGVDVDGANRNGTKWKGEDADLDCLDLNCALLHLTIAASMAHI